MSSSKWRGGESFVANRNRSVLASSHVQFTVPATYARAEAPDAPRATGQVLTFDADKK